MELRIMAGATPGIELGEPRETRSLKVTISPADAAPEVVGSLLEPFGRLDGTVAWLSIDALRSGAGVGTEGGPPAAEFTAMIDYARGQGWVSADGLEVRAHCERA
ncbi:MAG: hypothetical protein JWN46_2266 [Acidimicrobiales bacterium]|nr:hypothetical protein [Acidimicrobiales bacterium]